MKNSWVFAVVWFSFLVVLFPAGSFAEDDSIIIPEGRYKGQKLDVRVRRSAEILEINGTSYLVDFFYHEGKFWRATIPVDGVDKVIGQAFDFNNSRFLPPMNHVSSRYVLKPGYEVALYDRQTGEPGPTLNDFVASTEATGPKGVVWNLPDAFMGNLYNAHRFYSTRREVQERLLLDTEDIGQTIVLQDEKEKEDGLRGLLEDADKYKMTQRYYLYRPFNGSSNCTSNKFSRLDAVSSYNFSQAVAAMFLKALPFAPGFYLKLRGKKGDDLPKLNTEFAASILAGDFGDPAARRFARHYTETGERRPVPVKCPEEIAQRQPESEKP